MFHYHTVYVRCLDRAVTFTRCGWCGRKLADGATSCSEAFGIACDPEKDWRYEQYMNEELHKAEMARLAYEEDMRHWYEENPYG